MNIYVTPSSEWCHYVWHFFLFDDNLIHVVAISFTALILTELTMVALTIRTWHPLMLLAELASILVYLLSLIVLRDFFGIISTSSNFQLI